MSWSFIGCLLLTGFSGCKRSNISETPYYPPETPPPERRLTREVRDLSMEESDSAVMGWPCPEFALPDQDGQPVHSRDLRGTWVILNFHRMVDAPPCACHATEFTGLLLRLTAENTRILGISRNTVENLKKLRKKYGLEMELLSDPQARVMLAYGAYVPSFEGVERSGVIRTTFIIDPDGRVQAYWSDIQAEGHPEEVAMKLRELRAY